MVTLFIKIASSLSSGEVILTGMVMKGVLKDSMKWTVEGRTLEINRMGAKSISPGSGPQGASVMQSNWMKEAKERQIIQIMLRGADLALVKKYQGKNVEFQ